jgi:glycosyltransferase involved in cell wall biosynthesis
MRLAIIPEGPISSDGKEYLNSEMEGYYVDRVADHFDKVTIYAYALHNGDPEYAWTCQYHFRSQSIRVKELPLVRSEGMNVLRKLVQLFRVGIVILRNMHKDDLLYLFLPGYPSVVAFFINKLFRKPYFVYAASDWGRDQSLFMFRWQGVFRRVCFPVYWRINEWLERRIVKGAMFALVAGGMSYERYSRWNSNVFEVVPRLNWTQVKLHERRDTCQTLPIQLLYVGGLIHLKGIRFLIEAVHALQSRGKRDVRATIVGTGELRDELEKLASQFGVQDRVKFVGHVPNGPELFAIYRSSDIFVFPSMGEGFPRVLYEAMSQSLPIVTTNVSGIPHRMKHEINALLVDPGQPAQIANAVERMIEDGELRRKLIAGGYSFMRKLVENSDGGRQVDELLRRHCDRYCSYTAAQGNARRAVIDVLPKSP